jgi:hypothetical protein
MLLGSKGPYLLRTHRGPRLIRNETRYEKKPDTRLRMIMITMELAVP